jgi:hypothetical protein
MVVVNIKQKKYHLENIKKLVYNQIDSFKRTKGYLLKEEIYQLPI